ATNWMRARRYGAEKTDLTFAATGHQAARTIWALQLCAARAQARAWRFAALVSASILVCLTVALASSMSTTAAIVYVIDAKGPANPERAGSAYEGLSSTEAIPVIRIPRIERLTAVGAHFGPILRQPFQRQKLRI